MPAGNAFQFFGKNASGISKSSAEFGRLEAEFSEKIGPEFARGGARLAAGKIGEFLAVFRNGDAGDVGRASRASPFPDRGENRVAERRLAEAQPRAAAARKHQGSRGEDIGRFRALIRKGEFDAIDADSVPASTKADIYASLGGSYTRIADFSKAKIYLDKAESLYKQYELGTSEYINLMNSLAITDEALNQNAEAEECYKKVIPVAIASNLSIAYNIINSYSVFLANNGKSRQGEKLLNAALERARSKQRLSSRTYIEVLINYANFLRENKIDNKKSVEYFARCLDYIQMNQTDLTLKAYLYIGYSLSLNEAGEHEKALKVIDSLIDQNNENISNADEFITGKIK